MIGKRDGATTSAICSRKSRDLSVRCHDSDFTRDSLDLPLQIALVLFAVNIPFQIILFFMRIPFSTIEERQRIKSESRNLPQRLYSVIGLLSTPTIVIGFIAIFWHFHWWLGVLFALAAWAAYRIFDYCAL